MQFNEESLKSIGCYKILKSKLQQCECGHLALAEHQLTKEKVMIKILSKQKLQKQAKLKKFAHQIAILKKIRHATIIQLYEIIQTMELVYVIFEYIEGVKLNQLLLQKKKQTIFNERFKESVVAKIFSEIITCLEYLKKEKIVHNNIKPSSFYILKNFHIKLTDFQDSKKIPKNLINCKFGSCSTKSISSSELMSKNNNSFVSDIQNACLILYQMLCRNETVENKNKSKVSFNPPDHLTRNAKDILFQIFGKSKMNLQNLKYHPFIFKHETSSNLKLIQEEEIEQNVLKQLQLFGIQKKYALKCVLKNQCNYVTTMYWLLKKKHMKQSKERSISPKCQKFSPIMGILKNCKDLANKKNKIYLNTKIKSKDNKISKIRKFHSNSSKKRYMSNSEKKRSKPSKKFTIYSRNTDRRKSELSQQKIETKVSKNDSSRHNDYFLGSGLSQINQKQKKSSLSKKNSQIL